MLSPEERSRLADRGFAIERKLQWLSFNGRRLGHDITAIWIALDAELKDIQARLATP